MRYRGILVLCGALAVVESACVEDDLPSDQSSSSSSSSGAGGTGGGGPDCFTDPTTHLEIINACTDAEQIDKVVNLPLLGPDGALPPLP